MVVAVVRARSPVPDLASSPAHRADPQSLHATSLRGGRPRGCHRRPTCRLRAAALHRRPSPKRRDDRLLALDQQGWDACRSMSPNCVSAGPRPEIADGTRHRAPRREPQPLPVDRATVRGWSSRWSAMSRVSPSCTADEAQSVGRAIRDVASLVEAQPASAGSLRCRASTRRPLDTCTCTSSLGSTTTPQPVESYARHEPDARFCCGVRHAVGSSSDLRSVDRVGSCTLL